MVLFIRRSGNFKGGREGGSFMRGGSPGTLTGSCLSHPDFPLADAEKHYVLVFPTHSLCDEDMLVLLFFLIVMIFD